MNEQAEARYQEWLTSSYVDEETKQELRDLAGNEAEIEDRFYRNLKFGTGGLRGVIGAGTNRMNIYTVRQATQGLADYILAQHGAEQGCAIAFDSRHMSPEFSEAAALVLNANGIRTYRFETLRPTPELSFAVRQLHCKAGIVITASHNPAIYNGYKVYWEDGAQITPPHDGNIMKEVAKVTEFSQVKTMLKEEAVKAGLYHVIGKEMDDAYIAEVKALSIHPEVIREEAENIRIVYSPLHGTGNLPVRRLLSELGFVHVSVVPEHEAPDPDFSMIPSPNPENPEVWKIPLAQAEKENADIILATDPDADRLGVYAKNAKTGKFESFTGNMSGMLIAEYILRERTKNHTMPENPALVDTIVTTDMAEPLCEEYGVKHIETLTGFKYIGEQIHLFEQNHTYHYVFGFEESYGCLPGTYARDKDAPAAVMMLCELAAFYKHEGKTLCDAMHDLYEKYGYYREGLVSIEMKGITGAQKIHALMERMRSNPEKNLGGSEVLAVRDYKKRVRTDCRTGTISALTLPESDVLYYELADHAWCCARPSGTEPKIKFYFGVCGKNDADAEEKLQALKQDLLKAAE